MCFAGHVYTEVALSHTLDVNLMFSTQIGENWGTKMIVQKWMTDDRVRLK